MKTKTMRLTRRAHSTVVWISILALIAPIAQNRYLVKGATVSCLAT